MFWTQYDFQQVVFEEVHGKRLWLCKYQHAEKVASDNMGLVDLAVMATGFYNLLACQASDVCWENC